MLTPASQGPQALLDEMNATFATYLTEVMSFPPSPFHCSAERMCDMTASHQAVGPLFDPPVSFQLLPVDVEATYPRVRTLFLSCLIRLP